MTGLVCDPRVHITTKALGLLVEIFGFDSSPEPKAQVTFSGHLLTGSESVVFLSFHSNTCFVNFPQFKLLDKNHLTNVFKLNAQHLYV